MTNEVAKYACQNCYWIGLEEQLNPIQDIFQRVEPGERMPAGECPECGALAHQKKTRRKRSATPPSSVLTVS